VTSVDIFISGSKDGSFKLWDTRFKQVKPSDSGKGLVKKIYIVWVIKQKGKIDDVSRIPVYHSIKSVENAHIPQTQTTKGKKRAAQTNVVRSVTCALFLDSNDAQVITSGSNDG
jgi:denticleless